MESIESIFMRAREIVDAQARRACVNAACREDPERARRVEALLADDEAAAAFFEQTKTDRLPALSALLPVGAMPEMIGPYRILERLGGGGMGEVYRAAQRLPVKREVAVKLIQRGLDSKHIMARFEAERQALALLSHPNIAKVYDAGLDENERPYFVMEYVPGRPITEYADMQKLPVNERMELFCQVCEAVQHAHSKGIIHRDLKPTNILVFSLDGRPHVKIIDFGVAKATAQQLTESTLFTLHLEMVGTPAYMSPEQAECSPDIDTRSDIYSLGVLLYELLTGHTPHDSDVWRKAALHQLARIISETEPPKPSTRLGTLQGKKDAATTLETVARARSALPQQLIRQLRGELDWVVMKAMDKVPSRRYDTAKSFAEDVRHFIQGEPVRAVPPSTSYRVLKWMKMHRAAAVAGLSIIASLVVAIAGTTLGLLRERVASREARAQTEKAEDALYSAKIGLAQAALESQRYPEVREVLESCSTTKRGWEWQVLNKRANGGIICQLSAYQQKFYFTPDASRLVQQWGTSLNVVDAKTGRMLPASLENKGNVLCAHFLAQSSRMLVTTSESLFYWDAVTGETGPSIPEEVRSIHLSGNEAFALVIFSNGTAQVFDTRTGSPAGAVTPLSIKEDKLPNIYISPDGTRLLVGTEVAWDNKAQEQSKSQSQDPFAANFIPEDPLQPEKSYHRRILELQLWDLRSGHLLRDRIKAPSLNINWFPGGVESQKPDQPTRTIEFSPDGKRFLICARGRGQLWNAETGEPVRLELTHGNNPEAWWPFVSIGPIVWSPNGRSFLTFTNENEIFLATKPLRVWDAASGSLQQAIKCDMQPKFTLFSPDGAYLLRMTYLAYPELILHHLPSRQTKHLPLSGRSGSHVFLSSIPVSHFQKLYDFSPDGRHLLAPVSPTTSRVFHLATGEPVSSIMHHDAVPLAQSFTLDGAQVVICSGSWKNEENLWMSNMPGHERVTVHALDGRLVGNLAYSGEAEETRPDNVIFSADGRAVVPWHGGRALVDLTSLDQGIDLSLNDRLSEQEQQKKRATALIRDRLEIHASKTGVTVRSQTQEKLWSLPNSDDGNQVASFSPDGGRILHVDDGVLRVYEAGSGRGVCAFFNHYQPVALHLPRSDGVTEFWYAPGHMLRWDHRTLTERQAEWTRLHDECHEIHAEALRLLDISELDYQLHNLCDDPEVALQDELFQRETAHYPPGWLPRVRSELRYELAKCDLEYASACSRAESVLPRTVDLGSDPFAKAVPVPADLKSKHQQILREEIQKASSGFLKRRLQEALKAATAFP